MATTLKLRTDIKKLKGALSSKSLPAPIKAKLKAQLDKAQNELKAMQSGAKPRKVSTTKGTKTALTSLQKLVNKKKFSVYQGKGIDLKKDADQGALAVGRRVSKGLKGNQFGDAKSSKGNVYYEYRANRLDVKQPKKAQKYPKLEDGGMMAKGGKIGDYKVGDIVKVSKNNDNENYDDFRGKKLKIVEKITIKDKHPAFDESLDDQALYSFEDAENEDSIPFSLYDYELESAVMAKGGKLEVGVYRVGKPTKIKPNFYEQKIVEIFDNGDISTASDYGRSLQDFKSQSYPIISVEQLNAQYKMASGGKVGKHSINGYGTLKNGTKVYIGEGSQRYPNTDNVGVEGIYYDVKYQDGKEKLVHMDEIVFPIKGRMAKGGEVRFVDEFTTEDGIEISTAKTNDGKTLYGAQVTMYPLQRIIPFTSEDKNAVVERAKEIQSEMIEYLSKNEHRSDKLNQRFYAKGGVTEKEVVESNAEMVLSKIKEVHHHADELGDIVTNKSDIEAWVVAKIERASTDLSDITHYLDGQHEKMSMGGSINNYVHKMDKK